MSPELEAAEKAAKAAESALIALNVKDHCYEIAKALRKAQAVPGDLKEYRTRLEKEAKKKAEKAAAK